MSTLTNARIEALRLVNDGLVYFWWPMGPGKGSFRVTGEDRVPTQALSWLKANGYIRLGESRNIRRHEVVLTDDGRGVLDNYAG